MCIVLISNKHPDYPLILASNRDEYLGRPTLPAGFWTSPNENVLGGRDLLRPAQGTWLGVTKDGRIAVLTNFREDAPLSPSAVSRGEMVNAYLTAKKEDVADTGAFVKRLISGDAARGSGGFSLVCGRVGEPLAVVSNRMQNEGEVKWVGKDGQQETVGLSNATFGDRSWPKVMNGEEKMNEVVRNAIVMKASREDIVSSLFELLSIDTLPARKEGDHWETVVRSLKNSILIPKIGAEEGSAEQIATATSQAKVFKDKATSGSYGTQKQTVVVVDKQGHLFFQEKTLFDQDGQDIRDKPESIRAFEFQIG